MKSFLIAAGVGIVAAIAMVFAQCREHAGDSCGIAQGMAPYVAGAVLIVLWPLVYGLMVIFRNWTQPPRPGSEA